jgi:hypothetical protein
VILNPHVVRSGSPHEISNLKTPRRADENLRIQFDQHVARRFLFHECAFVNEKRYWPILGPRPEVQN